MKLSEKQYIDLELEIVTFPAGDVLDSSPLITGKDEWEFPDFGDPSL